MEGGHSSGVGGEKQGRDCSRLVYSSAAAGAKWGSKKQQQPQQQQHAHKLESRRAPERVRRAPVREEGTQQQDNVGASAREFARLIASSTRQQVLVPELWVAGRRGVRPSLRRGPGPAGAVLGRGRPGRPLVPAVESDAARRRPGVPELVGFHECRGFPPRWGGVVCSFPHTVVM